MKIYISSDHGGFELKEKIQERLASGGVELVDLGPDAVIPNDDYPKYAFVLAAQIVTDPMSIGILICRAGNGMAIAANRVKGIRAAVCLTPGHAKKAREDDHANVLVLAADYVDTEEQLQIVDNFIRTKPSQDERHLRRVMQIENYRSN